MSLRHLLVLTVLMLAAVLGLTPHAEASARRIEASVTTDKQDYSPGETAHITGSGFPASTTVVLQVVHLEDIFGGEGHEPWPVTTDANGNFETDWYVNPDDSTNASFLLTAEAEDADGNAYYAEHFFTDSVTDVTITSITPTSATSLPANNVKVSFDYTTSLTGTTTATATFKLGGTTYTASKTIAPGNNKSDSISINIPVGAPNGAYDVTVKVENSVVGGANFKQTTEANAFTVNVVSDAVAPTSTATPTVPANAAGWNNANFSVNITATDNAGGTGVQSILYSINGGSTITVAGASVSVPITAEGTTTISYQARDVAGNVEGPKTITLKLDKTAPTITFDAQTPAKNGFGWNNANVSIPWSATDGGSGISGAGSGALSFTSEGADQTQSVTVTDAAGNSKTLTSPQVSIDKTAPILAYGAKAPAANAAGWNNTNVSVPYTATDDLSGIDPSTPSSSLSFSAEGAGQSSSVTIKDKAGNSATGTSPLVSIDKTKPTLNFGPQAPAANAHGWNNTDVTFGWTASDALSGVSSPGASGSVVIADEGAGQSGQVTITDVAGNSQTFTTSTVKIDKTAPVLQYGSLSPAPNGAGWNKTDVSIPYTASDALSGVDPATPSSSLSFTAEGAGQTGSVTIRDLAGNETSLTSPSVSIDKTMPTLAFDTAAPAANANGWNKSDVTIGYTASDSLSGVASPGTTGSLVFSSEGQGMTQTVTVTDIAGNSKTFTTVAISIDKTKPTLSFGVASPSANTFGWNKSAVTIPYTTGDTLSGVESSLPATDLVFGTQGANQTKTVTVTDRAGNSETFTTPIVNIDLTPPSVQFGSLNPLPNAAGWNKDDVAIPYTVTDDLSGVDPSTPSSSLTFTVEGSGLKQTVVVKDQAGNTFTIESPAVNLDKTAPTITAEPDRAKDNGEWYNHAVTWTFTGHDSGSGVSTVTDPIAYSEPDSFAAFVTATCTDVAGNTATKTFTFQYDQTKPAITIGGTSEGAFQQSATIGVSATDLGQIDLVVTLDGNPVADPSNFTVTAEAHHTLVVTATDEAGNIQVKTIHFTVDHTAPEIVFDSGSPADGGKYKDPQTLQYHLVDALDPNPFFILEQLFSRILAGDFGPTSIASPFLVSDEGEHKVELKAQDHASNATAKVTRTFLIDKTPPTSNHGATGTPGDDGWFTSAVMVTINSIDPVIRDNFDPNQRVLGSGVERLLTSTNGIPEEFAVGSAAGTLSAEGITTLTYQAKDNAGNLEDLHTFSVKIDTKKPATTHSLSAPANALGWHKADVTVTLTATDETPGSGVKKIVYSIGGGPDIEVTGSSASLLMSQEAITTITYHAVDNAGNAEEPHSLTIKLDKTAPTLVFAGQSPAKNGFGWNNEAVSIGYTTDDNLSGVSAPSASGALHFDNEGANQTQTVTVTDVAGNTATFTNEAVNIDMTAPTLQYGAQAPAANAHGWNNTSVSIPYTGADSLSGLDPSFGSSSLQFDNEGAAQTQVAVVKDKAGNVTTLVSPAVSIDKTKPTLNFDSPAPAANAHGWNNTNVTFHYTAGDNLSGVDGSASGNLVLSDEGADVSGEITVTDLAGNSETFTSNPVKIDKTAPNLTYQSQAPAKNGYGWNNSDVSIPFTASDNLSGVDSTDLPSPLLFTAEAAGQTKTVVVTDLAGNSASFTSAEISIDKTKPQLTFGAQSPAANAHGWNRTDVSFPYSASDNLSGIATADPADSVVITGEGQGLTGTVTLTDKAGNTETFTTGAVKIDRQAPTLNFAAAAPAANAHGWNNTDVTIGYTASDSLSGVDTPGTAGTVQFNQEGASQTQSVTVTDLAGNSATFTTPAISIDKTKPTLAFGGLLPAANANGWNKSNVTIGYTTSDNLSGVDTPGATGNVSFTAEGANQTQTVTVTDLAGNSQTFTSPVVNIDKTAPVITTPGNLLATATSASGAVVNYSSSANDALSGMQVFTSLPATGSQFAPGATSVVCTATDKAGNTSTASFDVSVSFGWSNLLQPINTDGTSVFKLGSTIPVKFKLAGASAGITNAVVKLYAAKITNAVTGQFVEASSTSAADSGNTFRYDATAGQYIFNLGTKGLSEGTWTLKIDFGDGVEHLVNISLRK